MMTTMLTVRRRVLTNLLLIALALIASAGCGVFGTDAGKRVRVAADPRAATAGPAEELRAMFVATAYNKDWPSQAGLHQYVQHNEIDAVILRARELNCNAIFLQVRAFGDRIYETALKPAPPWAMALNFSNSPGYDPLGMWCRRAHEEGIQLYAWVNPYRTDWAILKADGTALPFFASADGEHMYLDPTSIDVQNYLLGVIEDLLTRYPMPVVAAPAGAGTPILASMAPAPSTASVRTSAGAAPITSSAAATTTTTAPGDQDGIDGIVVDHYFPDPNNPGGTATGTSTLQRTALTARVSAARPTAVAAVQPKSAAAAAPSTSPSLKSKITTSAAGLSKTALTLTAKPPNPRIKWLLTKHKMPVPYVAKNDAGASADDFIEQAYKLIDGKGRKFGISPAKDQFDQPHANAKKWLQKGWCHYFIPELYHPPATFQTELDKWVALNVPPDPNQPNRKPLLVAGLMTNAVEQPYEGTTWPVSHIEQEIDYARAKGVSQAHYTWRSLRTHRHGGPPDTDNVGDKVKTGRYKDRVLPPPANAPAGTLPNPVATPSGPGLQLSVPGTKVHYWAVWAQSGTAWNLDVKVGKRNHVNLPSGTHILVQASDRFDRKSAIVPFTVP